MNQPAIIHNQELWQELEEYGAAQRLRLGIAAAHEANARAFRCVGCGRSGPGVITHGIMRYFAWKPEAFLCRPCQGLEGGEAS